MTLADQIKAAHLRQEAERQAAATEVLKAVHYALAQVFDGATLVEASCFLDHFEDLGWRAAHDQQVADRSGR